MTSFNTCTYPGCCERIPYEIKRIKPLKYCTYHAGEMLMRKVHARRDCGEILGD